MTDNRSSNNGLSNDTNGPSADPMARLTQLAQQLKDQRYPPVHKWEPDFCGDIDMRIASDGTWYYMGTPIGREPMVRLFSTVLRHDEDGKYYLVTPVEKLGIQVDDAPFVVIDAEYGEDDKGDDCLILTTKTGDIVQVDDDHPLWVETDDNTEEPRPYVRVRDRLHGLINRPVFYRLVEKTEAMEIDDKRYLGLWSCGSFFPIGPDPADA